MYRNPSYYLVIFNGNCNITCTSKWLPVQIPVLIDHAQVSSFQTSRVAFRLLLSLSRIVTASCMYAVRVHLMYQIHPNIPTSPRTTGIKTNKIYSISGEAPNFVVNKANLVLILFLVYLANSTCYQRLCPHYLERQLCLYDIWYLLVCVEDCLVCTVHTTQTHKYQVSHKHSCFS